MTGVKVIFDFGPQQPTPKATWWTKFVGRVTFCWCRTMPYLDHVTRELHIRNGRR